jgi:hypothetical protein
MFVDKISDFSVSFSVDWSVQLFITEDITRTASRCFQPTFKNIWRFCCDQNHRLKDDRSSIVIDPGVSFKLNPPGHSATTASNHAEQFAMFYF